MRSAAGTAACRRRRPSNPSRRLELLTELGDRRLAAGQPGDLRRGLRSVASRNGRPGPDVWLVLRRRSGSAGLKVFLDHAPGRIMPACLVRLTCMRRAIETCFQEGRQLLGLSDCEDRVW